MKIRLIFAMCIGFCLQIWADNIATPTNDSRYVNVLERRFQQLVDRIDLLEMCVDGFLSNRVERMSREYESRLKDHLSVIDSEVGEVVRDREFYTKRYVELKSEYVNLRDDYDKFVGRLGNWLTGIGIFVALFGVGLPIVMVIIEHCKTREMLRWARDRIGREIVVARNSKERSIQIIRKDNVDALHMCLTQVMLNYNHVNKTDENKNDVAMLLVSIVLCFVKTVEAAMRTGEESIVRKQIQGFRKFADRWSSNDDAIPLKIQIWHTAVALMKNTEMGEYQRNDYAKILGESSDAFRWLMNFFNKCFHGRYA